MRHVLVVLAVAVAGVLPLWWAGESFAVGFDAPVSNLAWDEGQRLPGHGEAAPGPGAGVETAARAAVSLVGLPAVLVTVVWGVSSARHHHADGREGADDAGDQQ